MTRFATPVSLVTAPYKRLLGNSAPPLRDSRRSSSRRRARSLLTRAETPAESLITETHGELSSFKASMCIVQVAYFLQLGLAYWMSLCQIYMQRFAWL